MYALAPHQFSSVVCQTLICFTCKNYSVAASSSPLYLTTVSLVTLAVLTLGDGIIHHSPAPISDDDDLDDGTGCDKEHSAPSPVQRALPMMATATVLTPCTLDDASDDTGRHSALPPASRTRAVPYHMHLLRRRRRDENDPTAALNLVAQRRQQR
ncbi:hypothetical protein EDB83DRAFT_2523373 [Lactarius deliciosus]|nr:hypothetical protein EDB83DRAFT_2523373 [Lactarius deliciosus]